MQALGIGKNTIFSGTTLISFLLSRFDQRSKRQSRGVEGSRVEGIGGRGIRDKAYTYFSLIFLYLSRLRGKGKARGGGLESSGEKRV